MSTTRADSRPMLPERLTTSLYHVAGAARRGPRGEFQQSGFDAFSLGGEEYQRHRSTWEPEDLAAIGYRVAVLTGLHNISNALFVEAFGRDAPPVDGLLAGRDRG